MQLTLGRDIMYNIFRLLQRRVVRHTLAWIVIVALLVLVDSDDLGITFTISKALVNMCFYMLIVYFNLYYLIPNYLSQKTFITYGVLLVLSVSIISILRILALYFLYTGSPISREYLLFNIDGIFLVNMVVAGGSTVLKILSDWMRHQRDRKELQTQTMQSEIRFLKSQINPHFLFNTLNSLYALTLKKSDKAPDIVIKLSEMMRYMLYECNERRVPLRKEVNYLENYIELEKLRQGQNVDIRFAVEGEIRDQMIAPLLFIPFLENSFKHGLNAELNDGFVSITLSVHKDSIDMEIANSKPSTKVMQLPGSGKPSGGIGLVNVRRRLDLLYPRQYNLKIDDAPDAYRVFLNLDLD